MNQRLIRFRMKTAVGFLGNLKIRNNSIGFLRNLKIRNKLLILSGMAVLFMGLMCSIGYYYMNAMASNSKSMYGGSLQPLVWLEQIRINNRAIDASTLQIIFTKDDIVQQQMKEEINKRVKDNDQLISNYEKTKLDPMEIEMLKKYKEVLTKYRASRSKIIDIAATHQIDNAYIAYTEEVVPLRDLFIRTVQAMDTYKQNLAEQINKSNEQHASSARRIMLCLSVVALLLFTSLSFVITRMITKPIEIMAELMEKAESGDLTVQTSYRSRDEVGNLMNSFTSMLQGLRNLMHQVSESALTLAASSEELSASAVQNTKASEQIASASQHLSDGMDLQVKSISEASSAVHQMSEHILNMERSSQEANILAEKAASVSKEGEASVAAIVKQMSETNLTVHETTAIVENLGKRTEQISTIVGIINEIATHTNLLSLNAAIEAARAGESGRGFAVVASEVRKLSEQSSNSSKQINELIGHIQSEMRQVVSCMLKGTDQMERSLETSRHVQDAFKKIENSVKIVTDKVEGVSDGIRQLALGSEQIVNTIEVVRHVSEEGLSVGLQTSAASQEQLASTEDIAHSAQALSSMADELQITLQRFKL